MPVAAQVVQAGVVVVPVADPFVAPRIAGPDNALGGLGEGAGAQVGGADDEERPGAVAGTQFVEEAVVGGLVGGDQFGLRAPTLAGVEGCREVVESQADDDGLRPPVGRLPPDVALHAQQGTVVVGAVVGAGAAAVVVADHATAGEGVDLVVGSEASGGEGAEGEVGVGVPVDSPVVRTVPRAGDVAVARGVGVADELDLPAPGARPVQDRAARSSDEAAEQALGPRAFRPLDEPHAVLGVGESLDPGGGWAGRHEGGRGCAVYLDVVVVD